MSGSLEPDEVTILDVLDRVLDRGVVLSGNLTISVAGVDLLFVDLQLVIAQCVRELETRNAAPEHIATSADSEHTATAGQAPRILS